MWVGKLSTVLPLGNLTILSAILKASSPLSLTIPIAPSPKAVDIAQIVSLITILLLSNSFIFLNTLLIIHYYIIYLKLIIFF